MKGKSPGSLLGSLCFLLRLVRVLPVVLDQLDDVREVQAAGEDIEQHFILLYALHELLQGELACESAFRKDLLGPAAAASSEQPPGSLCIVHPKPHHS